MTKSIKYIAILILLWATSCSPMVRFASNTYNSTSKINDEAKKSTKEVHKTAKERKSCADENLLINTAEKWIGVPYQFGGSNESGVDCSALVQNVYNNLGISVPRTAAEQYDYSIKLNRSECEVGDLVFFQKNSNKVTHVGIYAGKNEVIHASTSRGVVRERLDTSYLLNMLVGFGRICQR